MRAKDIGYLILVIIMSLFFGRIGANILIGEPDTSSFNIETVEDINPDFKLPDHILKNKQNIKNPSEVIISDDIN